MVRFAHILCPVDLSDSSLKALAVAAAVARWFKAPLTVLHVVPTFDAVPVRPERLAGSMQIVQPPARDELVSDLRKIVADTIGRSPKAEVTAEAGDPAAAIVGYALAHRADLIVMGTHGRTGVERFMVGSVAEKVLRKAACPVLTIPPHLAARTPEDVRFSNILCPIDLSPSSLQAFGFARELASQAKGSLTVLHVVEWMPDQDPPTTAAFDIDRYRQTLIEDARQRMRSALAETRGASEVREVVVLGRAYHEILRTAAEAHADLIVMGAQGRGGLRLALFGSTTQQVIRGAECPVLTARLMGSDQVE